ncbi:MAG: sugar translocase [Eggerthella sp. 51_9]|nr:MAG: sugar translocase [Eggerthella sp. 51_9]
MAPRLQTAALWLRFALLGAAAAGGLYGVGLVLSLTLVLLCRMSSCGVPYLISTTISFVVSVIFNYFASMRFVFKRKDDMSRRREFIIFIVLSVCGLGINDLLMWLMVDSLYIDYRLSKIVVTVVVAVWNFVTRKIFLEAHD